MGGAERGKRVRARGQGAGDNRSWSLLGALKFGQAGNKRLAGYFPWRIPLNDALIALKHKATHTIGSASKPEIRFQPGSRLDLSFVLEVVLFHAVDKELVDRAKETGTVLLPRWRDGVEKGTLQVGCLGGEGSPDCLARHCATFRVFAAEYERVELQEDLFRVVYHVVQEVVGIEFFGTPVLGSPLSAPDWIARSTAKSRFFLNETRLESMYFAIATARRYW
jgi:hypothetical protein